MSRMPLLIFLIFLTSTLQAQTYVSEVEFYDSGRLGTGADLGIDLERNSCGFEDQNGDGDTTDPTDIDPEPFFDTLVSIKVKNQGSLPIYISKMRYRFPNAKGKLRKWMGGLSPVTGGFIAAQSEGIVGFFVFRAKENGKTTFKPAIDLSPSLGFQDIAIKLDARSSSGRLLQITAKRGLSFGNEDRCSAN